MIEDISPVLYLLEPPKFLHNFSDRIAFIKREMIRFGDIKKRDLSHPDYIQLFDSWKEYIEKPYEDIGHYEKLKNRFIELFGEYVFKGWLDYSYVFHQNHYMQKRKLYDLYEYNERL
jgi:hypothetical protein